MKPAIYPYLLRMLLCLAVYGLGVSGAQAQALSQNSQLAFGTLQRPSSGSQTFIVSSAGATSGTGTKLYGSASAGSYNITRGSLGNSSITINIANINTGSAAVTLSNFTGKWGNTTISSFPASGLSRPVGGSGTTLLLGATLTYTSSAPIGSLTPTFDIVLTQP